MHRHLYQVVARQHAKPPRSAKVISLEARRQARLEEPRYRSQSKRPAA
jgi:hypothetical protein